MNVSNERAMTAGFTARAPEDTARETLAWAQGQPLKDGQLTPEHEAQVLAEP